MFLRDWNITFSWQMSGYLKNAIPFPSTRKYVSPLGLTKFSTPFFVTKVSSKNVFFVTIATNRPRNQLIFKYIFRVRKSPWKVLVLLHREIIGVLAPDNSELHHWKSAVYADFYFGLIPCSLEKFGYIWTTFEPRVVQGWGKFTPKFKTLRHFTCFYKIVPNHWPFERLGGPEFCFRVIL